jgi:predicted nucleic acid-binding protein
MPGDAANLFWDSCIFYSFLDKGTTQDVSGIEQYLYEARNGKCRIYASSLVLAEVVPSAITKQDIGTFHNFIDDLQGAVYIADPSPDVMHQAALLKDLPYRKVGASKARRLSTTDAIILATCLEVRDAFRVKIDAFHTFDDGKKRDPVEGKMVPLISYQDWCDGFSERQKALAAPVINLNRRKPDHPAPTLSPII